jgi:signal transduction histidine kinase
MGQTELKIFLIIANLVLVIFIAGILVFVVQYRKRKLLHEKEKAMMDEAHKQEMLLAQLEMQQQTMADIGREIHDNIGQKLTLASLYTQQLDYDDRYPDIKERINGISDILNESLSELRSLSKSLTNTKIAGTSLPMLIETEVDRINVSAKCKVMADVEVSMSLSTLAKTIILRVVQEFFQNSLKHSGCKNIELVLKPTEAGLLLQMNDDGIGYDMQDTSADKGIGLQNIHRRVALIEGQVKIFSAKGMGTQLELFLPTHKLNP